MKKRVLTMFLAAGILGISGVSAQLRLTLSAALEIALSENPTVRVAEMEVALVNDGPFTILLDSEKL